MEKDGAGVGDGEPVTNMSDHSKTQTDEGQQTQKQKKYNCVEDMC